MNKKKVSLVQVNFQQGPTHLNAYYLPYSIGLIWSYAYQFQHIKEQFELDHIIFIRENINANVEKLKNQDIIAFSCYVWNKNYSLTLAKKVKEHNPNCKIIFGGPEVAYEDIMLFKKNPFIDIVVKNEGELVFKEILDGQDPLLIPGLVVNQFTNPIDTGDARRIDDLSKIPSPYLTGFFDKLIESNPHIEWNATLETNRGCPYACTFCDWGSLTYNKVKLFDLKRIFDEMEWIAKHRCGYLSVTDANFGMFVDRDNAIIDKFIDLQKKYGYPYTFNVSWAKNQKKEVINIVKKLIDNDSAINHGLTLSFQSFDPVVLDLIKRKNMHTEKINEIFDAAEKNGVPVLSELILGLPGETIDSWKENFFKLFRAGNHSGIDVFQAQLLENAEMNKLQRKLYNIKSITVFDYMSGSHNNNDLAEGVEIITQTKTMPFKDMIQSQIWSLFINSFHIHGLTNWISRFLFKFKNLDYKEFYNSLWLYIQHDNWVQEQLNEFEYYTSQWMCEGKINHPTILGLEIHGWNLIHRFIINLHVQKKKSHIMNLLNNFIIQFDLDEELKNDLINLQNWYTIDYSELHCYPKVQAFNYNIYQYVVNGHCELNYKNNFLQFDFLENKSMNFQEFLEKIYYSRRRNFGKSQIKETNKDLTNLLATC